MKKYSVGKYIAFAVIGLCIFAAGFVVTIAAPERDGLMLTLPYVCIGLGAGIFGGNLGTAISNNIQRKNPEVAKKAEIETNDERNIALRNKSKAKAYDLMVMVFGALMLMMALMRVDTYVILAFVAAYLFVIAAHIYYIVKYNKEM